MHRAVLATLAALATVANAQVSVESSRAETSPQSNRSLEQPELADSRIARGLEISPVPLDRRGKNTLLLGLGSYLVNATGGCNDCHTSPSFAPGGDPFKGEAEIINTAQFLAGGRRFGPIVSANITPDDFGRLAGLTFEQFVTTLRTGRDHEDASRILQVMPWNVFGKMTDLDLRALYEYLRAIPSLPDNVAPEVLPAPSSPQ